MTNFTSTRLTKRTIKNTIITRETLTIKDKDRAREIIDDFDEEFRVVDEKVTSQSRWFTYRRAVVKRVDGKFFEVYYSEGSTEQQDQRAFEYEDAVFVEVFQTLKTVIVYE